jgi:hypothetical protein
LFTELSRLESGFGEVMYVRIDHNPQRPDLLLSDQTLYLAPGATLDVLASEASVMGLDRVGYSPGLRAQRKLKDGVITYRFQIPDNALPGAAYLVQCLGELDLPSFSFTLQVS